MTPTHTAGRPPLVTLRIGDARQRTEPARRRWTLRAVRPLRTKALTEPVTGSKASEVTQGDASAATSAAARPTAASSTDQQAAHDPEKWSFANFIVKISIVKKHIILLDRP